MFNGVIIVIGMIEFLIGVFINLFAKSESVCIFIQFLYDLEKDRVESLPILNKWIGQNYGLIGSIYIFFASIARAFNINWFILILAIFSIELLSYRRINKGIKEILKDSQ